MTDFTAAWQGALVAQHQAVFGDGLLGPHLTGADQPRALAAQAAHESARDAISAAMVGAGVTPAHAAADYASLYPVNSAAQAVALAARLEDDCATAWRVLYAAAALSQADAAQAKIPDAVDRRREAQAGLNASAVAAARWRKLAGAVPASRPFPGL